MKKAILTTILAGLLVSRLDTAAGAEKKKTLGEAEGVFRPVIAGDVLEVPLDDPLAPAERTYLGLGAEGPFTIGAVQGDLVVVEFFNASCYACALMAPVMDEVWKKVAARPDLQEKVRFVGIGIGNSRAQVRAFSEQYETPFPMLADPAFTMFEALGTAEGTPYLMLLRRGDEGLREARALVGHVKQAERLVAAIEDALAGKPPEDPRPRDLAGVGWRTLKPSLSGPALEAKLTAAAAEAGLPDAKVVAVALPDGETFYRLSSGGKMLWAKVAGRAKVCNVCHDIFFIVLFDDGGRVVDLAPITITKYKNVEFDEKDVAFLRSRVVGKLLSRDLVFDPTVDAVSTATMSSALVFDTLRRLGDTWAEMVKAGKAQP
jgi:hypothetical protein